MKLKYIVLGIFAVGVVGMCVFENMHYSSLKKISASVYGISSVNNSIASSPSTAPLRPLSLNVCNLAAPSVVFANPPTGSSFAVGGYLPVAWTWGTTPAVHISLYLVPQSGSPILFSQYSTATNITTNGTMTVTSTRGGNAYGVIPANVPAGQYRMEVVNGNNTLVGCSGTFTISPASVCTPTFGYLGQFGTSGTGNGQFTSAWGITTDAVGNVYVADAGNDRVQKFNQTNSYLSQFSTQGAGIHSEPDTLAVDTSGNIYVADVGNSRIQKFSPSGTRITQWGSSGTGNGQFAPLWAFSIALDPLGNVLVADTHNNRIQKFSSSGVYLSQFGTNGTGNGQFRGDWGVTTDSAGNIYVVDTGNNRVQKFSSSGVYLSQWGSFGSGNGQFNYPDAIFVDLSGNVYVADANNNRVQKFSSSGIYLSQWGSAAGNGHLVNPAALTVDSAGNVYVLDSTRTRIQKFGMIPCAQS